MKCDFILTPEQKILVESNLSVIEKTISQFIYLDEGTNDPRYADLYQEGAVALCKAAVTYDGKSAQFSTYATTVIRNHLYNCCKADHTRQRKLPSVSLDIDRSDEDQPPPFPEPSVPDGIDDLLGQMDTADLLADCKRRYSGVARLGVEALEMKLMGMTGADIARLYDAKPNQVGAWISRAAKKIRKELAARGAKLGP